MNIEIGLSCCNYSSYTTILLNQVHAELMNWSQDIKCVYFYCYPAPAKKKCMDVPAMISCSYWPLGDHFINVIPRDVMGGKALINCEPMLALYVYVASISVS